MYVLSFIYTYLICHHPPFEKPRPALFDGSMHSLTSRILEYVFPKMARSLTVFGDTLDNVFIKLESSLKA